MDPTTRDATDRDMTDRTAPAARGVGLLINRDFALLWGGAAVSALGDFIFDTTLILWIATDIGRGQAWAPLAVSGVLVAAALPVVLVGPLAGVFVDRWDKRRTMLAMDALRAVVIALLLLATNFVALPFLPGGRLTPLQRVGAIYAVVFIATAGSLFFGPARTALLGDLVAEADRPRAAGRMQTVMALGLTLGPALAGPLYFGFGVEWALVVNALSFVASFAAVLAVRAPHAARSVAAGRSGHLGGELGAGVRFFAGNRVLRALLLAGMLILAGAGAVNALDIFFVTQNLRVAPSFYGYLTAAYGAGLVIGSLLVALWARWLGAARAFGLAVVLLGLLIIGYSRTTSYVPALAILFLVGLPNAAANAMVGPLLLHVTPRELVGRVSAILTPLLTLAELLATGLAGYLDGVVLRGFGVTVLGVRFGPVDTIFVGAGLLGIVGGLYALAALRGLRLEGEGADTGRVDGTRDHADGAISANAAARETRPVALH